MKSRWLRNPQLWLLFAVADLAWINGCLAPAVLGPSSAQAAAPEQAAAKVADLRVVAAGVAEGTAATTPGVLSHGRHRAASAEASNSSTAVSGQGASVPEPTQATVATSAIVQRPAAPDLAGESDGAFLAKQASVAVEPEADRHPSGQLAIVVRFELGSYEVSAQSRSHLRKLARVLVSTGRTVLVDGHTDRSGSASHNQRLSQKRARAVAIALEERGVAAGQLRRRHFGEQRPLTGTSRSQNRRVEVRYTSLDGEATTP